jgi:hypothetical protein
MIPGLLLWFPELGYHGHQAGSGSKDFLVNAFSTNESSSNHATAQSACLCAVAGGSCTRITRFLLFRHKSMSRRGQNLQLMEYYQ